MVLVEVREMICVDVDGLSALDLSAGASDQGVS